MFLSSNECLEQLNKLIAESDSLDCAVAFWGQGVEELFANRRRNNTRIICNLKSGATNPNVIQRLEEHAIIRQNDTVHAKVIVGSRKAIVGSANFSCNGLNLEGSEQTGWEEAGILTTNANEVDAAREWFESLWQGSRNITPNDIRQAQIIWNDRRKNRPTMKAPSTSLLELPVDRLKDRSIYLVIARDWDASLEAGEAFAKLCKGLDQGNLTFYEDWGELPEGIHISLDYTREAPGELSFSGVHKLIPGLNAKFVRANGNGEIQVCRKATITQASFNRRDQNKLLDLIRPAINDILDAIGGEDGGFIEFSRAIEIARQ